jgi:hypothetical protein
VWGLLGLERFETAWLWLNDLHFFRDAAGLLFTDHAGILYRPEERVDTGLGFVVNQETFPYPAPLALLFVPLTWIDFDTARLVFLALSIAAAAGSAYLAYRWSHDARLGLLVALTITSSFTYYEVLRFSQLSPFIGLLSSGAMVAVASGRSYVGGLLVGLLALKPSVLIAPGAYLAASLRLRATVIAGSVALAIGLLGPLLLVGPHAVEDYKLQLDRYSDEAFKLHGEFTAGAGWMLGWNGFVGRLLAEDPPVDPVVLLDALTIVLVARIWSRRDAYSSWLAASLGTLLVIPHALWYDWVVLLSIAPFAAYVVRSGPLLLLLVGLHLAVSIDSYVILKTSVEAGFPGVSPVLAAGVLATLAFGPVRRPEAAPASVAA